MNTPDTVHGANPVPATWSTREGKFTSGRGIAGMPTATGTHENENGETVHANGEVMVEPGTTGFGRAFVDELPSPFDCSPDVHGDLPSHK